MSHSLTKDGYETVNHSSATQTTLADHRPGSQNRDRVCRHSRDVVGLFVGSVGLLEEIMLHFPCTGFIIRTESLLSRIPANRTRRLEHYIKHMMLWIQRVQKEDKTCDTL